METDQQSIEQIISYLATPESYKQHIKPFKIACSKGDEDKISLVTTTVETIINEKDKHKPMAQLNGIRLIKESMSKNKDKMYEEVLNKVHPLMVKIGNFQKQNQSDDRGKTYFNDHPDTQSQILGNSFFRLVLECLLVWGLQFPYTDFESEVQTLLDAGVKFPQSLNYFKDIDLITMLESSSLHGNGLPKLSGNQSSKIKDENLISAQESTVRKFDIGSSGVGVGNSSSGKMEDSFKQQSGQENNSNKNANGSNSEHGKNNGNTEQQNINYNMNKLPHSYDDPHNNNNNKQTTKPNNINNSNNQTHMSNASTAKSFKELVSGEELSKHKLPLKTIADFRQFSPGSQSKVSLQSDIKQNSISRVLYQSSKRVGSGSNSSRHMMRPGTPSSVGFSTYNQQNNQTFSKYNLGNTSGYNSNNYGSNMVLQVGDNMDYGSEFQKLNQQLDILQSEKEELRRKYEQEVANNKTTQKLYQDLKKKYDEMESEYIILQQKAASKQIF